MPTPTNGTVDEQVAVLLHDDITQAVTALANGAAMLDATRELLSDRNDRNEPLWFLVRALCHEHKLSLTRVTRRAREVAAGRLERLTQ